MNALVLLFGIGKMYKGMHYYLFTVCLFVATNAQTPAPLPIPTGGNVADVCAKLLCTSSGADQTCGVFQGPNGLPVATCIAVRLCVGNCPLLCLPGGLPLIGGLLGGILPNGCLPLLSGGLLPGNLLGNLPLLGSLTGGK
jgi:hypothetical protein